MNDYTGIPYKELDPKKKNYEWANQVTSGFRIYWRPLVDPVRGAYNRSVMYGLNSLDKIKKSFKDKEFIKSTDFKPLPILEAIVNSVVEEITQQPPRCEIRAQDPLAVNEKDDDVKLLKSRKILEFDLTRTQTSVGLPPYKMPYDDFNGNVQEFDEMGLDESDPEDMSVYKNYFQRLWVEIGMQAAVNAIVKYNQFDESTLRTIIKDVFAFKAISTQVYVDQVTGEIKHKYIDPLSFYGIFGDDNSGKNDVCRGWYRGVTVMEWLGMVGNEFDFERDWKNLLWGINYYNNWMYTGFIRGGVQYSCLGDAGFMNAMTTSFGPNWKGGTNWTQNLANWDNAYMFKIGVGYMEFNTPEATSSFVKQTGTDYVQPVDYDYEISNKEEKKGYYKESKYQYQWYRLYFIGTSSVTQYIYGFQKLYFQHLEGVNDEYSNGSLCYYQEQGQSATELSETMLGVINLSFYRYLWLLWHTKPLKNQYILQELLTLASAIQEETTQTNSTNGAAVITQTKIEKLIQQQEEGNFELRVFPKIDGKTYPQLPPDGRKHGDGGVDPTAIGMQSFMDWGQAKVERIIGFNPMRFGANPPNRESLRTEENTVAASQNATGYMYRMAQYLKEHMCISTMNYIVDILKFPGTVPYKWLQTILGTATFEAAKNVKKYSPHTLGIFVDDVNLAALKKQVMDAAAISLNRDRITLSQYNMLAMMQDPKLANARLEIMERHAIKRQQNQLMQLENQKAQNAMALESKKQETEGIKAQAQVDSAKIGGSAQVESARIQSDGRLEVKQLQVDAEPNKQFAKAQADKELLETENNLKNQQPLTEANEE